MDFSEASSIEEVVQMAVGAASLCWLPKPEGVFDATQAEKICDTAVDEIQKRLNVKLRKDA